MQNGTVSKCINLRGFKWLVYTYHVRYKIPHNYLPSLGELYFCFLANWKEYDRSDNLLFDYEPNGILFCLYSKEKLSIRSYNKNDTIKNCQYWSSSWSSCEAGVNEKKQWSQWLKIIFFCISEIIFFRCYHSLLAITICYHLIIERSSSCEEDQERMIEW